MYFSAAAAKPNSGYPALPRRTPTHSLTTSQGVRSGGRKRLDQYQTGKRDTSFGLAAAKPEWHNRSTLVVAGLDKKYLGHKEDINSIINEMAGRDIDIHHIEILSREYNHWLTIAIELSEDDFNHLSNQDFWETGLRIRPYQGRRFWRQNRVTREQRQSSQRMTWART